MKTSKNVQGTAHKKRRSKNNKNISFLEWCLAWEILITSGGTGGFSGFRNFPSHSIVFMLFITALCLFFLRPKKKVDSSTIVMFISVTWLTISTMFFDLAEATGSNSNDTVGFDIDTKLNVIAMYLAVSALSFRSFREKFLKAATYLSAATLIVWMLHIFLHVGNFGYAPSATFEIFMDWGGRMASIYWEPGQYQIILTFTLVLFLDELRQFRISRFMRYFKRFGVIVIAMLVCQSTMAYVSLMSIITLSFMFNRTGRKNIIVYILMLFAAASLIFVMFNSQVIQEKISPDNLLARTSLSIRIQDNIALWHMSQVSPLLGIGRGASFQKYGQIYGNITGSNGWLYAATNFGWPFLLLIIWCIIKNLKYMKLGIPSVIAFIPLLLTYCNEYWLLFPITLIYIFKFRDYK